MRPSFSSFSFSGTVLLSAVLLPCVASGSEPRYDGESTARRRGRDAQLQARALRLTPEMGDARPGLAGGVVRSAEIEYALGNLASNKVYAWTPDDYKVSVVVQSYFVNFIRKGDPNGTGLLPVWPAVTHGGPVNIMRLDVDSRAEAEKHRACYLFLDQF